MWRGHPSVLWHPGRPRWGFDRRAARAVLLTTGAEDDPAFPLQTQRLRAELRQRYRDPEQVVVTSIPGMAHAFAAAPGIEPAPQTAEARLVDAAVTDWFNRHLS